jgi:hypothetical protein
MSTTLAELLALSELVRRRDLLKPDDMLAVVTLEQQTSQEESTRNSRNEADLALSTRRHRGKRVLIATLAASVGMAGLAFWAGTAVRGGAGELPQHISEPPVTVPIRYELLVDGVAGSGSIALPAGVPVALLTPQLSAPGAQPIITGFSWRMGSQAHNGDVLVEVAGEPIFLLLGTTPAYRDLQVGDHGRDVAELQNALQTGGFAIGDVEGVYGPSTAEAVAAIYRAHGYIAPMSGAVPAASAGAGGTQATPSSGARPHRAAMLPVWSAVYAKTLPATISAIHGAVGGHVSGGSVLLDLTSGAPVANISVEASLTATLHAGMAVQLTTAGGARIWGRVQRIVASSGDSSSSPSGEGGSSSSTTEGSGPLAGSTIVVGLPRNTPGLSLGAVVKALIVRASSHHRVLAIPISAVRTAADGSEYVAVERNGKQVRVGVSQGLTAGGSVAVEPLPGNVLLPEEQVVIPN